ncbi:MAG TPA: hypothetical protein VGU26_00835, partial [Gaiellaceae bacterium]|nr:hypothetical protein [Gaiellaceae bacterium]
MRYRLAIAVATVGALVVVSGASADLINGYTATGAPAHIKPLTTAQYTVVLTNTSPDKTADHAAIGIPAGFTVAPDGVEATATCGSSTWDVEQPVPSADGKITVRRQNGSENNLCPGGTLTIVFSATSPADEGSYVWATELVRGADTFVLNGNQPSVQVDGTAPLVAISSHPDNPTNATTATFEFSANEPAAFMCKLDD